MKSKKDTTKKYELKEGGWVKLNWEQEVKAAYPTTDGYTRVDLYGYPYNNFYILKGNVLNG